MRRYTGTPLADTYSRLRHVSPLVDTCSRLCRGLIEMSPRCFRSYEQRAAIQFESMLYDLKSWVESN